MGVINVQPGTVPEHQIYDARVVITRSIDTEAPQVAPGGFLFIGPLDSRALTPVTVDDQTRRQGGIKVRRVPDGDTEFRLGADHRGHDYRY